MTANRKAFMTGERAAADEALSLRSINPANGEEISSWQSDTSRDIDRKTAVSADAFGVWRRTAVEVRSRCLLKAATILESKKRFLAELMALEMGKPLSQGVSEIDKCALVCRYYAFNGPSFLEPRMIETEALRSYAAPCPLGVIYAVMPWNFPFWQFFRFAAPAVMAGNGILLKHSPNVTGCALEIAEVFREAGLPDGLPEVLLIPEEKVAEASASIISSPHVRGVTLTGSTRAGMAVAEVAGRSVKKCVLELGGSDPVIIFEDADLERAAVSTAFSRLINSGQNCIASKRFLVQRDVHDRFLELLAGEMSNAVMGDPLSFKTTIGPLARLDLRDELHRQVTESLAAGARLVTGGCIPELPGAFYPPTVIDGVTSGMPVFDEETFGPVAAVSSFDSEEEALAEASRTPYGLGASIYTADLARGERIAMELPVGACFVNTFVRSDPRLPFGGVGLSGYGRELSREGMLEFVNLKTVYISEQ